MGTDSDIVETVRAVVVRQIERDELVLPVLPGAAARALNLLSRPNLGLDEVAALIETDPLLAAQIVRLANSAAFGGAQPVQSILAAVTRLGTAELRLFLVESSARQVLESRDRRIARMCRGLWEHSLAVALLARDLAAIVAAAVTDVAYLGGLLHDVGKPVLASMLLDAEQRLYGRRTTTWILPETWMRLISEAHRPVAVALSAGWGLPEAVGRGIREAHQYDSSEPHSPANAVRLANALAKKAGIAVGVADAEELDELIFVGAQLFGLDDVAIGRLQGSIKERVSARLA